MKTRDFISIVNILDVDVIIDKVEIHSKQVAAMYTREPVHFTVKCNCLYVSICYKGMSSIKICSCTMVFCNDRKSLSHYFIDPGK